jgi:hypothetical protein
MIIGEDFIYQVVKFLIQINKIKYSVAFSGAQESLLGCGPAGLTEGCRSDEGEDDSRRVCFKCERLKKNDGIFFLILFIYIKYYS